MAAASLESWPAEQFCTEAPDVLPQCRAQWHQKKELEVTYEFFEVSGTKGKMMRLPPPTSLGTWSPTLPCKEMTWPGSPGGHSMKIISLNFLYPAAAREPSSERRWLIDEEELSELQQCPRAWGRW